MSMLKGSINRPPLENLLQICRVRTHQDCEHLRFLMWARLWGQGSTVGVQDYLIPYWGLWAHAPGP
jgi:hypothetical protein